MTKKAENILYLSLILVFIISIFLYKNYRSKTDSYLSKNGEITVGKIIKRNLPGARTISSISYSYVFYVDNELFEGGCLSDRKYPVGTYFEIEYLPDNPIRNKMNFYKSVLEDSLCNYFENNCPFDKQGK
jgi:hypothetical protein